MSMKLGRSIAIDGPRGVVLECGGDKFSDRLRGMDIADPRLREGWVFPSKRAESSHLTTMAKRFREAGVKAGLPEDLVLYCGRHDFGTRILKRTGNLAAVMRTMGHKDVKTAMQYQHPELEIVRAALDQDAAGEKRA